MTGIPCDRSDHGDDMGIDLARVRASPHYFNTDVDVDRLLDLAARLAVTRGPAA